MVQGDGGARGRHLCLRPGWADRLFQESGEARSLSLPRSPDDSAISDSERRMSALVRRVAWRETPSERAFGFFPRSSSVCQKPSMDDSEDAPPPLPPKPAHLKGWTYPETPSFLRPKPERESPEPATDDPHLDVPVAIVVSSGGRPRRARTSRERAGVRHLRELRDGGDQLPGQARGNEGALSRGHFLRQRMPAVRRSRVPHALVLGPGARVPRVRPRAWVPKHKVTLTWQVT